MIAKQIGAQLLADLNLARERIGMFLEPPT